jgi:hypothetical protein
MYTQSHSSQYLAKFVFTHSEVRAKPQIANKSMIIGGSKPRAAVFDGIRIIQDLRTVTGMCGACK